MKKLQKLAYMATGAIMALSVTLTAQVIASTRTKTAQLTYKNIKVNVNGVETPLTDLQGNAQEPFIAFDTVYAPVSALARALGKNSVYDGNINITDRTATSNSGFTTVKLTDLTPFNSTGREFYYRAEVKDTTDTFRSDCLMKDGATIFDYNFNGYRTYLLNGNYSSITGTFFLIYENRNAERDYFLKIWGDGKLIYESKRLSGGILPINFNVNIEGVMSLKIGFECPNTDSGGVVGISGTTLQKYK